MKSISYTTSLSPTVLESYLTSSNLKDSQFFIKKDLDYMYVEVNYHPDFEPETSIYKVEKNKLKTKVYSNTVDILATDVVVNGIEYYYVIDYLGGVTNYKEIVLNSSVECIEYKGKLYTNEKIINLEIKDNTYIFTKPVIDMRQADVKYRVKDIELTVETLNRDIRFKCNSDTVIKPTLINNSKIHIPSFYVKKANKIIKCLEGDIAYVTKKEYVDFVGNFISTKDLIHEYNGYFIGSHIFYPYFYFSQKTSYIEYVAKLSSHVFALQESITYFKIKSNGLDFGSSVDYDFFITKKINPSKFKAYLSSYLTTYAYTLHPGEHYIVQEQIQNPNQIVGLKNEVISEITRYPSESYYVIHNNKYYYQHFNSIIPVDDTALIAPDTYSDLDVSFSPPTIDPYIGFTCTKIKDGYYYTYTG